MKLIDADRVLRLVDNGNLISNSNYQKVRKLIENIPSIDLVRCKDCMFYVPEDDGRCDVIEQFDLPEMFFCGNGERGDSE